MPIMPLLGSSEWHTYSLHDLGLYGNIAAFACGARDTSSRMRTMRRRLLRSCSMYQSPHNVRLYTRVGRNPAGSARSGVRVSETEY
jgi:hypothetical protein